MLPIPMRAVPAESQASKLCSVALRRVDFDKRKGKTTSRAALDFIVRTCSCGVCKAVRSQQRAS